MQLFIVRPPEDIIGGNSVKLGKRYKVAYGQLALSCLIA
jgi:hypothetical protein